MWTEISDEENRLIELSRLLKKTDKFADNLIYINQDTDCHQGPSLLMQLKKLGIPCRPIDYALPLTKDREGKVERIIHL
jgi:hypothetical protein